MASPAAAKKQQGKTLSFGVVGGLPTFGLVSTELQLQYTNYKNTLQQLASKIGEVEQEAEEHKFVLLESAPCPSSCLADDTMLPKYRLVLETLDPVPGDRKCFRMINRILVERTVADVIPALKTNAEGLKSVLEGLVKEYKKKQQEMDKWKVCYWKFLSFFASVFPSGRYVFLPFGFQSTHRTLLFWRRG